MIIITDNSFHNVEIYIVNNVNYKLSKSKKMTYWSKKKIEEFLTFLIQEYGLIENKVSKLSRMQRDGVVKHFHENFQKVK